MGLMGRSQPFVAQALDAGFVFKTGWQRQDPAIRADALEMWGRLGLLPPRANPQRRADEIVAAAYLDDELAAVGTAYMSQVTLLRRRFAVWRVSVAPAYRRHHLMFALGGYSRDILESWSREHPELNIAGMATITSFQALSETKLPAVLPGSELRLIGYTPDGNRIRVAWFDHTRV